MAVTKPSLPKGTRDFLPVEVKKRQYIFDVIKSVYGKYGYVPIETPSMESLRTLMGKYGEEGDQLLFKVLNNGDFLAKANNEAYESRNSNKILSSISKRGLRYDLTVPFARYVVMHQNDLYFPFKRYQIQPVWRADRPQKGRYQEFYQCDADVVGSNSLTYEAELIQILHEVFATLNMDVTIKINNRKVLYGIAEVCGLADQFMDVTIAIDKLDKIGEEGVLKILREKDISENQLVTLKQFIGLSDVKKLAELLTDSETGMKGISELNEVFALIGGEVQNIEIDITLARGLNYYTGCILEVKSNQVKIGSIAGGGRYDDLTATFGLKDMSGVGISFGAARIFDVMEELNKFPTSVSTSVSALICCMDDDLIPFGFEICTELRKAEIACDLYPKAAKLGKQIKYADKRSIPHVVIIGETEKESGVFTVKDINSGDQEKIERSKLTGYLKEKLPRIGW